MLEAERVEYIIGIPQAERVEYIIDYYKLKDRVHNWILHQCINGFTSLVLVLGLGGQTLDVQQKFALVCDDSRQSHQTVMLGHHNLHSYTFHRFYDQLHTVGLVHLHERTENVDNRSPSNSFQNHL